MLFDAPIPRPAIRIREGVAHVPGFLDLSAQASLVSRAGSWPGGVGWNAPWSGRGR